MHIVRSTILVAAVWFAGISAAAAAPMAYVPNSQSGTVSVIDTATNTALTTIADPAFNAPRTLSSRGLQAV